MDSLYKTRDKYFGNGRAVRKVIEVAVRRQHLRMSEISSSKRNRKLIRTLTVEDLKSIDLEMDMTKKQKGIGFQLGS